MCKVKLGGLKRKLEHDFQNESKRRKMAEKNVKEKTSKLTEYKKKVKRARALIKRMVNRKLKSKNVRGKKFSRTWIYEKRKELYNTVNFTKSFLKEDGVSLKNIVVEDEYGNEITLGFNDSQIKENVGISVDRMLYIKDSYMISDRAYRELSLEAGNVPSMHALQNRMKQLNASYDIHTLQGNVGVQERIEGKLKRVIQNAWPIDEEELIIKITGDGTSIGSRLHVCNFGFCVITKKWRSDDNILIIAKIPEKYRNIKDVVQQLVDDTQNLNSVTVRDKEFKLRFVICADLKFTNIILGLGACSANFSCAWCKTKKCDFYNVHAYQSDYENESLARSITEIHSLGQLSNSRSKQKYNCVCPPVFPHIPVSEVIPDPLHL